MAWHEDPIDLVQWTDAYATRRYGADDPHARSAWQILLKTAYSYRADGNKVTASATPLRTPSSTPNRRSQRHAPQPGHRRLRYNPADFAPALTELLQIAPALRSTETYRYDLVT